MAVSSRIPWIRRTAWASACFFLLALAARDVQWDRRLVLTADVWQNRTTRYLTSFGPPVRVNVGPEGLGLVGEPVYVNLRLPRWFRRVVVEVQYTNAANTSFRVGVRTHPTQWSLLLKTVEPSAGDPVRDPEVVVTEQDGVTTARIPFALTRAWQTERNTYRLVLVAAPAEQPIRILGFRVLAERDPICVGRWCL
ncbi:hypothetical protein HYV74_00110 [Candidatus Uhrbacteria bacterium]|nr:hypothetical protein [Candidatus Uhrbacteria bacterium]